MNGIVLLGILLVVAWAVLWLGFQLLGATVHILVLVGAAMILWGLVKRGARAVDRHL